MLHRTRTSLWQVMVTPKSNRGGKNLAFKPKMTSVIDQFVRIDMQHPRRRPDVWQDVEFERLGFQRWPKQVGFWNAGDNWELTPEFSYRFFQHNKDADLWTQGHNEQTVVALMPLCASAATREQGLRWVHDVFQNHVARFGADHIIYNVTMQAYAFAKKYDDALDMFQEMQSLGLVPNGQSYVNMMFACYASKKPKELALELYNQAVKAGALTAVMRADYEFTMWWQQFERLGTFDDADGGYLANKEEGARPQPRDMWAVWGWDRDERKFLSRKDRIRQEISKHVIGGRFMRGSLEATYQRRPWYKYKGMFPWDYRQHTISNVERAQREQLYPDAAPPAAKAYTQCSRAY
eukprot:PhM_4_TR6976/c0_g1_i1/m.69772